MLYSRLHEYFFDLLSDLELKYWRPIDIEPPDASLYIPIWGEVEISSPLSHIYFLPIVQRLSEIKQLALTDSKYPGGNHTRLEHSLGVLSIARLIIDNMLSLNNGEKSIIELGMLLHDIGHGGWGHSLDGLHGYIMGLLKDDPNTKLPRIDKLDIAVAWYLLRNNDQMRSGLRRVAEKLEMEPEDLEKAISFIIAEDVLLIEDIEDEKLRQVVLYGQTILGQPERVGGVDADRIDWVLRDTLHLFGYAKSLPHKKDLEGKLEKIQTYSSNTNLLLKSLMKSLKKEEYKKQYIIQLKEGDLSREREELRNILYEKVYESEIKAFGDSILLRLALCAANALEIIGKEVASPSIYNRVILGYMLQPDHLLRETTKKILSAASEVLRTKDTMIEPMKEYIRKGYDLLGLLDVFSSIIHTVEKRSKQEEDVIIVSRIPYPNSSKYLSAFIFSGKILVESIEKLFKSIEKLSLNSEYILMKFASQVEIDPINALHIPSMEVVLEKKLNEKYSSLKNKSEEGSKISVYVIVNHYFFKGLFNELNKLPTRTKRTGISNDGLSSSLHEILEKYRQKHLLRVLILYEKGEEISGDIERELAKEARDYVKDELLIPIINYIKKYTHAHLSG